MRKFFFCFGVREQKKVSNHSSKTLGTRGCFKRKTSLACGNKLKIHTSLPVCHFCVFFARLYHSAKQIQFSCSFCDFTAKKQSALNSHLQVHDSTKELTCNECPNFSCKRTSELKRHFRLKHDKSKTSPILQCPDCTYETVFKQHLDRHRNGMHTLPVRVQ